MGKWCHVKCDCPNRRPLDPDNPWGAFECGHKEGALVRLWPGGFFEVAKALRVAYGAEEAAARFPVFLKIADGEAYQDEYMALSAEERDLWRLEVEQLQAYLSGREYMPWHIARRWQEY
ncbi:MAG TPA: hypothetical protein VJ739_05770 [Gemmataceae bacterium]|nr:hypothetical protein [Gemmataceae bacterium]